MPRFPKSILVLLTLLSGAASEAAIEHVIAISVDGLRGDYVKAFVAGYPVEFPAFTRLQSLGAYTYNARCDFSYSETVPNHLAMITGRPVTQPAGFANTWHHGFASNFPTATDTIHASGNPAVPYKSSVFDVTHDRGLSTALYYGKSRLDIMARSYNATNGALDTIAPDNGRNKIDYVSFSTTGNLVNNLVLHIQNSLERFTFLHITDPDTTGHSFGWTATVGGDYYLAIKMLDMRLGMILNALDAKPALAGKVAILLTGDHGGGGGSSLGAHTDATLLGNCVVPFFIVAPGISGGTNLYEILENRFDPAAALPSYVTEGQPVRNGDIANLSMELLGLPAIPGALMTPELERPIKVTRNASEVIKVSWPIYLTGWQLQFTDDLEGGEWSDEESVAEVGAEFVHTVASPPASRFFRLKRP